MSPLFVEHIVKIRKDKMIRTKEINNKSNLQSTDYSVWTIISPSMNSLSIVESSEEDADDDKDKKNNR